MDKQTGRQIDRQTHEAPYTWLRMSLCTEVQHGFTGFRGRYVQVLFTRLNKSDGKSQRDQVTHTKPTPEAAQYIYYNNHHAARSSMQSHYIRNNELHKVVDLRNGLSC